MIASSESFGSPSSGTWGASHARPDSAIRGPLPFLLLIALAVPAPAQAQFLGPVGLTSTPGLAGVPLGLPGLLAAESVALQGESYPRWVIDPVTGLYVLVPGSYQAPAMLMPAPQAPPERMPQAPTKRMPQAVAPSRTLVAVSPGGGTAGTSGPAAAPGSISRIVGSHSGTNNRVR